jgi:hypothetical protein
MKLSLPPKYGAFLSFTPPWLLMYFFGGFFLTRPVLDQTQGSGQCFFFNFLASARLAPSVMAVGSSLWLWVLYHRNLWLQRNFFLASRLWCFSTNSIFGYGIWLYGKKFGYGILRWLINWLYVFGRAGKSGYSMINDSCNLALSINRRQVSWQHNKLFKLRVHMHNNTHLL